MTFLNWLSKVLGLASVLLVFYTVVVVYRLKDVEIAAVAPSAATPEAGLEFPEAPSFAIYEAALARSALFRPVETTAPTVGPSGQEVLGRYRVVGIMLGREPRAAVENNEDQTTRFIALGDRLDGLVVTEIGPGRVVLASGEDRVVLEQ